MEQTVEVLFTEEVVNKGAELFNLELQKKLGSFENYVYEVKKNGVAMILRFTHSSHRTKLEVEAELAWLQYLKSKGAPVCGPFPSRDGNLVEMIHAQDTYFFVSLFEKAKGDHVRSKTEAFNEELFYKWGKATGILHRLTVSYQEEKHIIKRPDLVTEYQNQFAPFLPDDNKVKEKVEKISNYITNLPKVRGTYGLIHSDIHSGNFFYDGKDITIFDFDDCSYHHLVSDIAIPIYYAAWGKYSSFEERSTFINEQFLPSFLRGYREEYTFDETILKEIQTFLKFRDCELYGVFHKKLSITELNEKADLLNEIRERIVSDTPIVTINM